MKKFQEACVYPQTHIVLTIFSNAIFRFFLNNFGYPSLKMTKKPSTSSLSFNSLRATAAKAGLDWFLLALISMIGLAYLFPQPGNYEGTISLGTVTTYGVSLIFFFYGLKLSPEKMKAGLTNWRLHIIIHTTTFILFPILIYSTRFLFPDADNNMLWLGVFFVASLPSTVSSSVVMVSIAGGNIPAAIFNASISSLIGVFITPLWMGLVLTATEVDYALGDVILKLLLQVVVPVVLGILLHKRLGGFVAKHGMKLRYFDQIIILLIIYVSFCHSFAMDLFASFSATDLFLLGAAMLVLFFTVYIIVHFVSKALGFSKADTITAQFCGSKKSLVHGTVMSKVLFADSSLSGIILLPIMMYHAIQLLVASIIAQGIARRSVVEEAESKQPELLEKTIPSLMPTKEAFSFLNTEFKFEQVQESLTDYSFEIIYTNSQYNRSISIANSINHRDYGFEVSTIVEVGTQQTKELIINVPKKQQQPGYINEAARILKANYSDFLNGKPWVAKDGTIN